MSQNLAIGDSVVTASARLEPDRLVLGTAQLGLAYGRRRAEAVLPLDTAHAILDSAWQLGLRAFDTAEGYGDAALRLSDWLSSRGIAPRAHVVTKIRRDPTETIAARGKEALDRFGTVKSLLLLTHGFTTRHAWTQFVNMVPTGTMTGQSVYGTDELLAAIQLSHVTRIQVPANVFDVRPVRARSKHHLPLDLRSAYLQGVLLETPEVAEHRVPGGGALARIVSAAAKEARVEPAPALLASLASMTRADDRIVVGIDALAQFEAIRGALAMGQPEVARFRAAVDQRIPAQISPDTLDPRTW